MKSRMDRMLGLARPFVHFDIRLREVLGCVAAGVIFGGFLWTVSTAIAAVAGAYLLTVMLLVTVIDSRQFLIPDVLSLPAIPLGLLYAIGAMPGSSQDILAERLAAIAMAGGIFYAIRGIHMRLRGVEGLGLGDVKLAMAAGAWVGIAALPDTCLLAALSALLAILIGTVMGRSPGPGMTTAVPFGSFIAPAIAAVWLYETLAS